MEELILVREMDTLGNPAVEVCFPVNVFILIPASFFTELCSQRTEW